MCNQCTEKDSHCKYETTEFETCPLNNEGCFWYYRSDTELGRGCATEDNEQWQRCQRDLMDNCFRCKYHFCNSLPMRVNRTLNCLVTKEYMENTQNLMPVQCPGEVAIGVQDLCYLYAGRNSRGGYDVLDRGCAPFTGGSVQGDSSLHYCYGHGCNLHNKINGLLCSNLKKQAGETMVGQWTLACNNLKSDSQDWFPILCFFYVNGESQLI